LGREADARRRVAGEPALPGLDEFGETVSLTFLRGRIHVEEARLRRSQSSRGVAIEANNFHWKKKSFWISKPNGLKGKAWQISIPTQDA
jgi:hypothetical protein